MAAAINQVGKKSEKLWRDAVMRAVNRRAKRKGNPKYLDLLADKLVRVGHNGDIPAIKEIGDRLDGKPAQAIDVGVQVQITHIERKIIDPLAVEGEAVDITLPEITHDKSNT